MCNDGDKQGAEEYYIGCYSQQNNKQGIGEDMLNCISLSPMSWKQPIPQGRWNSLGERV